MTHRPIRPEDLTVGGLVNAIPANLEEVETRPATSTRCAKAASC